MKLNRSVWLPYLHFVLQTISLYYPEKPNTVTKKKYYNFINDLPLFFPEYPMGKNFIDLLDKYPVTPYLESRLSFMKWVNYIHNKIKLDLKEETTDFSKSLQEYYEKYKPKEVINKKWIKRKSKYIIFSVVLLLFVLIIYLYNKN